jgi:hypothetical protein
MVFNVVTPASPLTLEMSVTPYAELPARVAADDTGFD